MPLILTGLSPIGSIALIAAREANRVYAYFSQVHAIKLRCANPALNGSLHGDGERLAMAEKPATAEALWRSAICHDRIFKSHVVEQPFNRGALCIGAA